MTDRAPSRAARAFTCAFPLLLLTACSGGKDPHKRRPGDERPDAAVADGGGGGARPDGGGPPGAPDAGEDQAHSLTIEPAAPTLNVSGAPANLTLTAKLDGTALPKATWSTDNLPLGSIDDQGVFTSKGLVGGTATITARYSGYEATTTLRVVATIEQVDDGVSDAQKGQLDDDSTLTADAAFSWLYPYDGTVFPRGLPGPYMQFAGGAADALRVSAKLADFHYMGYFGACSPAGSRCPPTSGRRSPSLQTARRRSRSRSGSCQARPSRAPSRRNGASPPAT